MHFMTARLFPVSALALTLALAGTTFAASPESEHVISVDHYVLAPSTVPAIQGQTSAIYVREVTLPGTVARDKALGDKVVLFIHGAGTPAEVSFDVNHEDYSWMAYLAKAGFDVFAMDQTGYGRSTRPAAMNDPCNLSADQQKAFIPGLLAAPCTAPYGKQLTTIASDWNDITAVVDHLRALRHVDKINLMAWSLGGPRSAGWAGQHQDKVRRMVLLAPAYNRASKAEPPAQVPANGAAYGTQNHAEFTANWDRQVGCPNQYDTATSEAVWSAMLDSDPVGATWGTGVRRAPNVTTWGWTQAMAQATKIPTLMVSGAHDKQVPPDRVRDLYADLGATQKVFVDLACSSHNAMWEHNHLLLFRASLDWLTKGTVNGTESGAIKLGY
jgi:pimeloyl-ACP methyl ester carboxylesterase